MLTIHIQTLIARPPLMRQFNVRFADSVLLPLLPLSGKASDWSLLSQALAKVGNLTFSNQKYHHRCVESLSSKSTFRCQCLRDGISKFNLKVFPDLQGRNVLSHNLTGCVLIGSKGRSWLQEPTVHSPWPWTC